MKNRAIKIIVILGVLSLIIIFVIQIYWLRITYNQKELEFDKNVTIALKETAFRIADYYQTDIGNQNPVYQLAPDYFVVSLNDTVDHTILEFYLKKELENVNISADFEYGTYDCDENEMVYGNYISFTDNQQSERAESLATYAELVYYFGIRFPDKLNYISRSITLWTMFSAISVIFLVFFGYSIFTILQQQRYTELQKDFINNMTHEFKTPLSSIKLASDFFLGNDAVRKNDRLLKYSEIINEQNNRLNLQVENVLQIARTEKKSFHINPVKLYLNDVIQQCVSIHKTNLDGNGNISFDLYKDKVFVKADEFHLKNILHNIFDNSIKYASEKPDIIVKLYEQSNKCVLEIADRGIGIEEKYLKKVFKKFYRVPTGNVHDVKGFGLGLYYVKMICKKHRWKILLESIIDKGTTVKIRIPVAK